MYKYGIQGETSYICLLDISNASQTLISYEFKILDAQSKINFKAGVLGGYDVDNHMPEEYLGEFENNLWNKKYFNNNLVYY
ncbi:hypothetical protein TTHERM_000310059 (macronuclear) [Tetrahymena thermophila SB210]|uniref:Uncharacterized protein n=1 Tax=Tetrahymena thermophila (strain SB210) TaxID=312017 RepID=W7X6Z7_TETTS|nr:hypothetical protein TTHERM_000310059 [Tetrahymena thermophila SB210]EWS73142.1 hypothetical protein TTHERM_000310059 [Tetrahymena thermophila SB210]|eukprot:XP_012654329.1 hypothetical protein TTHERM_000310059 [Tetrahymena thermophila SB210]